MKGMNLIMKTSKDGFSFIEVMIVCIMLTFIIATLSIILDSGFHNVLYFNKVLKENDNRKYLFKTLQNDLLAIYFDSKYKFIKELKTTTTQSASSQSSQTDDTQNPFALENFGLAEDQIKSNPSVGLVIDNHKKLFSFVRLRNREGIDELKRITYEVTPKGLVRSESHLNTRTKNVLTNFGKNISFKVSLVKKGRGVVPFSNSILKSYKSRPDFFRITIFFKNKKKTKKSTINIPFHLYPVMSVKYKADGSIETTGPLFGVNPSGGSSGGRENSGDDELESEDI